MTLEHQAGPTESEHEANPSLAIPASHAQAGLWSVIQIFPDCLAYTGVIAHRILGPLDRDALRGALEEVIRRHESLRTRFISDQGIPVQVISSCAALDVPALDLRSLPARAREAQVSTHIARELEHRFDLERGPLVRAMLLQCADHEHVMVLNIHRLLADFWSLGVLFRELNRAYTALAAGRRCDYPAPKLQYRHYAEWQSDELRRGTFDRAVEYWRQQLEDLPPLLNLPTDRPRPAAHSFRGSLVKFAIEPELALAVREFATTKGMTPFAPLLAAFNVLLFRYSGQTDVVVGSPLAHRPQKDYEDVVGFFVNTMLLRTQVAPESTFDEAVGEVWESILRALAHRDAPFELLLQNLRPSRTLSYHALFQVMFAMQNVPRERLRLGELDVTAMEVPVITSKFDLMWSILEEDGVLYGTVEYDTDLFDSATVERMVGHYKVLLASALRFPGQRVSRVPLLTERELALALRGAGAGRRGGEYRRAYVLDPHRQIAPAGVSGALYVVDDALSAEDCLGGAESCEQGLPSALVSRLRPTGISAKYLADYEIVQIDCSAGSGEGVASVGEGRGGQQGAPASNAAPPSAVPRAESLEEDIEAIWRELLGRERIGRDDDFFTLGGYSLLAARIISRINSEYGVQLPLRAIFDSRTVRDLAATVAESREHAHRGVAEVTRARRHGSLAASFAQERMWFIASRREASSAYNTQFLLRLRGPLKLEALRESVRYLLRRHESLRTTFAVESYEIRQIVHEQQIDVDIPLLDLRDASERDVALLAQQEQAAVFDLASGPLLRLKVLKRGDDHHVLLVTIHHIVTDGWSMNLFIRDLASAYSSYAAGSAPSLRDLPVQYADYAAAQRERFRSGAFRSDLAYWKKQLEGVPDLLELRGGRPRPPRIGYEGATVRFVLPEDLCSELRLYAQSHGASLFMLTLSALQMVLHSQSGQEDLVVGVPVANRDAAELENVIGLFVNTVVVRTKVTKSMSFSEVLGSVRRAALEAFAHQELPFEKLVAELAPPRRADRHPLFQVMFVFHEAPERKLTAGELTIDLEIPELVRAPFDLSLWVAEDGGSLQGGIVYNTDLFDEEHIRRLLEEYTGLLREVASARR